MATMPMQFAMDDVKWEPTNQTAPEDGSRYATHSGVWSFMGATLRVYQLNTGERVIDADDLEREIFSKLGN